MVILTTCCSKINPCYKLFVLFTLIHKSVNISELIYLWHIFMTYWNTLNISDLIVFKLNNILHMYFWLWDVTELTNSQCIWLHTHTHIHTHYKYQNMSFQPPKWTVIMTLPGYCLPVITTLRCSSVTRMQMLTDTSFLPLDLLILCSTCNLNITGDVHAKSE